MTSSVCWDVWLYPLPCGGTGTCFLYMSFSVIFFVFSFQLCIMKDEPAEAELILHDALRLAYKSDNKKAITYTYDLVTPLASLSHWWWRVGAGEGWLGTWFMFLTCSRPWSSLLFVFTKFAFGFNFYYSWGVTRRLNPRQKKKWISLIFVSSVKSGSRFGLSSSKSVRIFVLTPLLYFATGRSVTYFSLWTISLAGGWKQRGVFSLNVLK